MNIDDVDENGTDIAFIRTIDDSTSISRVMSRFQIV